MIQRDTYSEHLISLPRLFITLLVIGFVAEAFVMFVLPVLLPEALWNFEAFADAALLTLISAPAIWWLVIRPLRGAALQEKAHAAAVIAHAVDGIITLHRHGTVLSCNPAAEKMFGGTADDLVGQSVGCLVPQLATDCGEAGALTDRLIPSGTGDRSRMELTGRRKDGAEFPVELSASTVRLDGRETLVAIIRDVTERRRTQEQLQKLSRAVEQSPSTVVITDASGRMEYVNPKFTEVTGYSADEVLGCNPRVLNSGRQSREFYREMWKTILQGDEWRGEFCNRKKSGVLYWEFASISPIRNSAGNVTHFVAVKEDITQRKRTEEELKQAKEAAESANRAKSQFLANMSHELRTPLNGVLGYAQILLKDPALGDEHRKLLTSIESCGEHLLTLINDVLDLSRIESGKLEIRSGPCDLRSLVLDVRDVVTPLAAAKGLRLSFSLSDSVPQRCITDLPKLRQVLVNLMANAVKFTAEGSVKLHVDEVKEQEIQFQVVDTGTGIPPDRLADIFEPFTQLGETAGSAGGTGLGLSISRRLIAAMGGQLEVESEPGHGSCFTVTLPLTVVSDDDMALVVGKSLRDQTAQVLRADQELTVLVADDNETNRDLLVRSLRQAGIGAVEAANGREAVERLRQHRLPLALLDVHMPEMDGIEATRVIRQDPNLRETVILLVSADVLTDWDDRLGDVGYDDFVSKPLRFSELLDIIARHTDVQFVDPCETASVDSLAAERSDLPSGVAAEIAERLRNAAEIGNVTQLTSLASELLAKAEPAQQYGAEIAELARTFDFDGVVRLADALETPTEKPRSAG